MKKIPVYGHRGCRALFPENSLEGFAHALDLGVQGIELDVVISKDLQVVVSHEPWFSKEYCSVEQEHNIFEMDYALVRTIDSGTKIHSRFPSQKSITTFKPLLKEVIELCNQSKSPCFFILELKSEDEWVGKYQPKREVYVQLIEEVLRNTPSSHPLMVQSFDPLLLNEYQKQFPQHTFGFLVENRETVEENLSKLNFKPNYYNLDSELITQDIIKKLHQQNIECVAWTVNEKSTAQELMEWGIDGIITDDPTILL
ncbi:MAG: hypothetical protein GY827_03545 [Cytophagales bacterium]|nr:hypothetical protein [Cytophagales bacterium]